LVTFLEKGHVFFGMAFFILVPYSSFSCFLLQENEL